MDPVLLIAIIIGAVCAFGIIVWAIIALVAMRQMRKVQSQVLDQFDQFDQGAVLKPAVKYRDVAHTAYPRDNH